MKNLALVYRVPYGVPPYPGMGLSIIGPILTLYVSSMISGTLPDPQPMNIGLIFLRQLDQKGQVYGFAGTVLDSRAHPEWERQECRGWLTLEAEGGIVGIGSNEEEEQRKEDTRRVA